MSRGLDCFHSNYVYRVLRPNENPSSDLTCRAPRSVRTISQHVATGLKNPSRYISTTSSMDKALKWIETANEKSFARYGNKRKIIVRIDVDYLKTNYPEIADSAYDLTIEFNRDRFLKRVKERRFSCAYNEVVFLDRIPSEAVSIEYIHGEGFVDRNKPASSCIQRHKQVTSDIYSGIDDLNYSPDTERKNVSNIDLFPTDSTSVPSKFLNTAYSQPAINVPRTIETTANPSVTSPSFDYNLPPRETIKSSVKVEQSYASPRYIKPSERYKDLNISPPAIYSSTVKSFSQRNTNYPGRMTEKKAHEIDQIETVVPRSYPNIGNKENITTSFDNSPSERCQPESSLLVSLFRLYCCSWCFV